MDTIRIPLWKERRRNHDLRRWIDANESFLKPAGKHRVIIYNAAREQSALCEGIGLTNSTVRIGKAKRTAFASVSIGLAAFLLFGCTTKMLRYNGNNPPDLSRELYKWECTDYKEGECNQWNVFYYANTELAY